MHLPLTVNSPPRQLSALERSQVPPPALPAAGMSLNPCGQAQTPLVTAPPSQTMAGSGRGGLISATHRPAAESTCVLAGHMHWPATMLAPSGQTTGGAGAGTAVSGGGAGGATAGAGDCAGSGRAGGGVCDGFATHWPFLKSCQGKQP